MSFVHLHVHSTFSDGMATPEQLARAAKERGYSALALTDHNTLDGAGQFIYHALHHGVEPILGAECNVRSRLGVGHIVVLTSSAAGFRYLRALVKQERVLRAAELAHHPDLYVTSSCLGGLVAGALASSDYWSARDTVAEFHDLFGPRYHLEIQPTFGTVLPWVLSLGRELAIPVVVTNDVHYLGRFDRPNQVGLHLATREEMQSYSPFIAYQGALENAGTLATLLTTQHETQHETQAQRADTSAVSHAAAC